MKPTLFATALAACALVLLPGTAAAADPHLKIPNFSHLRQKAVESTDITLDGFLMKLVKKFAADDEDDPEAAAILADIKSVRVREFEFDSDDAYSRADIDSVRQQLKAPGWSALVQAHEREPRSDVDVYFNIENDKILGLAVIVSEPRSFTIVNIVGNIDIDKLAKLEGQFGIPRVSQVE